ncbi:MAG TPA: hypothetical protein VHT21_17985 [Stellaceae bacterium]|nr:hypothetical protein [Stellaceae bacterium]
MTSRRRLQRLDAGSLRRPAAPAEGLKIVYPPDGALIEWRGEELPLEAAGGKRPLRWLVDGRPFAAGAAPPADLLADRRRRVCTPHRH